MSVVISFALLWGLIIPHRHYRIPTGFRRTTDGEGAPGCPIPTLVSGWLRHRYYCATLLFGRDQHYTNVTLAHYYQARTPPGRKSVAPVPSTPRFFISSCTGLPHGSISFRLLLSSSHISIFFSHLQAIPSNLKGRGARPNMQGALAGAVRGGGWPGR
jgi:hypothetical protein